MEREATGEGTKEEPIQGQTTKGEGEDITEEAMEEE